MYITMYVCILTFVCMIHSCIGVLVKIFEGHIFHGCHENQYFHDFVFEDCCLDFVNDYASRNEFQGLFLWPTRYLQK